MAAKNILRCRYCTAVEPAPFWGKEISSSFCLLRLGVLQVFPPLAYARTGRVLVRTLFALLERILFALSTFLAARGWSIRANSKLWFNMHGMVPMRQQCRRVITRANQSKSKKIKDKGILLCEHISCAPKTRHAVQMLHTAVAAKPTRAWSYNAHQQWSEQQIAPRVP